MLVPLIALKDTIAFGLGLIDDIGVNLRTFNCETPVA
jgi:hypothetical protein